MEIIHECFRFIFIIFILFYMCHVNYYAGLKQGMKHGIKTKATVLKYDGRSTMWAEKNKTLFELFYHKKIFYKYCVEFEDLSINIFTKGNLVVAENNLVTGNKVNIKYVVGKKGRLYIVPEECYKWFAKKFWIYTFWILCLFIFCLCKEWGVF